MKAGNILTVLFIASLFLMAPILKPVVEINLFPFENSSYLINSQGTSITMSSDIITPVEINITRINQENNYKEIIWSGEVSSINETTIDLVHRGYYLFEFRSSKIARITIDENGIPLSSITYPMILLVAIFANRLVSSRRY